MTRFFAVAAVLSLSIPLSLAHAEVRVVKDLPLTLAIDAVTAAVADCTAKGYSVTAAVVDRSGLLRALHRADNASPHTIDTARRKAYTSLAIRAGTTQIAQNVRDNPVAAHLGQITDVILLGGGMPIRVGNDVIGAIGVGGTPSGLIDDQCAEAGIARIKDQLN
jgi:uncharacterized protein GlcG (DUF336 family)